MYIIYIDYIDINADEIKMDDEEEIKDGIEYTSSDDETSSSSASSSQPPGPDDSNWDPNNTERFTPNDELSKDDQNAMAWQILLLRGEPEAQISEEKISQFISTCTHLSWRLACQLFIIDVQVNSTDYVVKLNLYEVCWIKYIYFYNICVKYIYIYNV